ncbi:uncharacterized protein LOC110445036 [Mizuhopecten yessoensis]|uniref:uncharacterized protein LOC110445036 n=1 Tax=Mizuhopecten yessoensis TaxID=6573 RepID=UPI000B45EFE6|nr:uncharacterized protein LOC110445036 [Mizuhopecten yessoensis]
MEATDVDTPGNVFSINLRISLTIDAGTVFLCALRCSVLLLCVWLSCRNNTTTLDNNTTTSDRHCLTVFVKTSVLGHQINRSNEPLYLNDKQYSLHNTSPQISFSSSNSAKHGVEHERYIDATAAGDGIQSNQTNGKHERVNSSSDVEHVKEKQTYTYTCIYDRKLNYDDDYGIENTTTFDDCQKGEENQSYIRSEEFKPNGTDRRTSDERADVSFSSTDSGIFIHNIREENKSTVLARDCTRFDKVKASDKSLDSAESGIFLSINTRDGHSDSSEYERRGQTNSSKDFRNPSQDQRICQLDNESISISQTIAERNVEHKYEFNDTLMSCTTECDQNHKDDGITEEDGFEETIPKSLYKVQQPRKTLSVYRKSEDVFHYVSKDSEDGFVGLMLGSMENVDQPAVPTRGGTRPDLANTLDRLQKERPMDTNRIDIPSENRNINIDSPTHVGLHHGLKTYDEHNQKPKDMSFWPFNSDCKYNEDGIFSRECSLIVNQSLLTLDSNGNNLPRQTLSSHHRLNSKQLSHVLTRRRQRRMHRKAHKENIRMVLSKYEMNRFFKSFTSRSEVKRVFPYRKCSLRYNTSAERFTGLLNRRNNETIVSPFLNQNEIPRPDIFTSDDGNRERSPAGDVYEYPNGAIDAISVATVTESMQYEWGRLRSFWSFPMDSPILPITLAKYGFYYTGRRDEVVCFSCNVSHSNWRRGDSVYAVHYQMSKRCRFMNGEDVGNIPIHGPLSCLSRRAGGRDDPLVRSAEETELGSILSTPERVISLFLGQDQANQIVAPQLNQPLPEVQKDQTETNDSLPVVNNPIETRNGTECGGGSKFSLTGLQAAAPSGGASVSRAASVSPESTITMSRPSQTPSASQPACLQTHASTTSHTALGPHTATSNAATPAANRLLTGPNASPTSNQVVTAPTGNQALTDQTCNQPQSMNQQHPTTFAQRQQQRRLEQQDQREQQQPEQGQAGPAIANGAARNLNNQVVTAAKPRYPNYAVLAVRSGTFNGFPNHLDQTPLQMARAGFFYAGL